MGSTGSLKSCILIMCRHLWGFESEMKLLHCQSWPRSGPYEVALEHSPLGRSGPGKEIRPSRSHAFRYVFSCVYCLWLVCCNVLTVDISKRLFTKTWISLLLPLMSVPPSAFLNRLVLFSKYDWCYLLLWLLLIEINSSRDQPPWIL